MSDLYFGSDLFSEFERSQRRIDELFGCFPPSTRSVRCGGFAPGVEPEQRRSPPCNSRENPVIPR
jgi:hypothetical protein